MDSSHYYHTLTIFITLIGLCYGGGVLPDTLHGAVEGNVIFTTTLVPTNTPLNTISWFINSQNFLSFTSPNQTAFFIPGYKDRITLDIFTGSLELRNLALNDSGTYIVNTLRTTGQQSLQGSTELRVLEKVSDVSINPSSQPIIEGMSVHLTCAAAGSISTREWMKGGWPLSSSDRVSFSGDNSTVSISPVNRQDSGVYLCRVRNLVSSQDAEYIMTVNYGPDSVTIEGPLQIEVGQKLTLICLADSKPTANYSWAVNGTEWPGQSQEFTKENIQLNDSGTYNCTASNDVTERTEHAVHTLEVKDEGFLEIGPEPVLTNGAIAGIVIAVLVLVGGAGGLTVYFIKKKDYFNKPSSRGRSASSRAGNINGGGPADQDLNYADVTHFRKKDGGSVQLGHQAAPAESTVYAQVKGRPAPQPGTPRSIYPEDVNYAAVSHSRKKDGGSVQLEHQAAPAESTVYADVRVNGQPTSYTAHLPNSQTKRPAPQPAPPPSTYSEVRKD